MQCNLMDNFPMRFFLSKSKRSKNNILYQSDDFQPVLDISEADLGFIPDHICHNIFFKNGQAISFHENHTSGILKSISNSNECYINVIQEIDGQLKQTNYNIDCSLYDKLVFSNDLVYCVTAKIAKRPRCPSNGTLCLSMIVFNEYTDGPDSVDGQLFKNICKVNHNNNLSVVKDMCLSPHLRFLVIGMQHEGFSGHFDLFQVDVNSRSIKHYKCILPPESILRITSFGFQTYFNSDETNVLVHVWGSHKAFHYDIKSTQTSNILLGNESELCIYGIDQVFGQLFFVLDPSENIVKVLKLMKTNLLFWYSFELCELGIFEKVVDFKVCNFGNTKVLISSANYFYVIDPFNKVCPWRVAVETGNHALCVALNWSGEELFTIQECDKKKSLKVYHLPQDVTLKNLSTLTVLENFSIEYLKALNLPKLVSLSLGIAAKL